MTPQQETNTIQLVEALLSGKYKHNSAYLYRPETDCYSFDGVAAMLHGFEPDPSGQFTFPGYGDHRHEYASHLSVPAKWFAETFGLPRTLQLYQTMNDRSQDFLAVAALLIAALPLSRRQSHLRVMLDGATSRR